MPVPQKKKVEPIRMPKIGKPGYRVTKMRDPTTNQRSLLFQIEYPKIDENFQPRHRFMSSFEQRIEPRDKNWQYLLFAAPPYDTIAFKIPNLEVEKDPESKTGYKIYWNWDRDKLVYTVRLFVFRFDCVIVRSGYLTVVVPSYVQEPTSCRKDARRGGS